MATEFQRTASKILKGKIDEVRRIAEESVKEHANNIVQLLRTRGIKSGAYSGGQGIGVEADKRSQYSMSKWYTYKIKSGKDSVSYRFRNKAVSKHNGYPYVDSIYGGAFRSKKLSEARWNSFKNWVAEALAGKVKYDIYKRDL